MEMKKAANSGDDLQAQREYVAMLEQKGFGYDLAIGDAFVRGMRDIGYKSTSYAVAEIGDNAIQAGATHFDVLLQGQDSNINEIAMVDNGHGMEPKMLRISLIWGGGHRGLRKDGMGKYGYGLPSASVSQAERVEVYSKPAGGKWHKAYLDIIEIKEGKWTQGDRIKMPEAKRVDPPKYVLQFIEQSYPQGLDSGTVVVWKRADRLDSKQKASLRNQLLTDLGVIYRNYLRGTSMSVNETSIEPCDPLFSTEGARFYDIDEDRAVGLPAAVLDVSDKDTNEKIGQLRVRFAMFPATFFRKPEAKLNNKPGRQYINDRLRVADKNNGIIFMRAGRQIDVVRPPRESGVQSFNATTDRFWAVEVDFDPTLDNEFRITTAKQQVVPSDKIWDVLKDGANLTKAIGQMRSEYKKLAAEVVVEAEESGKRASEEVMEQSEKFKTVQPAPITPERQEEIEEALTREVTRRARESKVNEDQIRDELVVEQTESPYKVQVESLPGAPLYRPEQRGAQKVLYLNSAHRFFAEVYAGPDSTPRLRAALELLLWSLADAELDATEERQQFYLGERALWSQMLTTRLDILSTIPVMEPTEPDQNTATIDAA
jgi:hypothetical protein